MNDPSSPPRSPGAADAADAAARLRTVLRLGSDWCWEQDAELRFVAFDGAAELARPDYLTRFVGRRRWEVPDLAPASGDWSAHRADLEARRPFRDLLLVHGDLQPPRYMRISGEPVLDRGGRFLGYRGIARDVTDRVSAERAIAESEARFRAIFDQAGIGIAMRGRDGRLQQVNQKLCDILGYTREELLGMDTVAMTHPDERPLAAEFNSRLARGEVTTYSREKRYLRKDGGALWANLTINVVRDAKGDPAYAISTIEDITARKAAELRARAADERLRDAIEHLDESIAIMDAEDRILVANRYFRALNGNTRLVEPGQLYEAHLRAGAALGNYPEAVGREEEWLQARLARYRAGGRFEVKRQNGVWLRVTDQRLPDGGMISYALDITARKEAELALAASEARFRDFAHSTSDWFWETDAGGTFTWMSESVIDAIGTPPAWFIGKRRVDIAADAVNLEDPAWRAHLGAYERHEAFRGFRYLARTPSGSRWLESSGVPHLGEDGAFLGYRGSGRDVTEIVEAERRARAADDRLRSALENLGEMIALTDAEDRIVLANRRFVEFNAAVAEFVQPGRRYDEHLRAGIALGQFPEAKGREQAWLAERMALRRRPLGPVERRRQDGRWLLVDDQLLPDGSTISFGLEITERKHAEEALRDINAELERRVAERTAQLEATNRELEAFSYSVSHDLRAPLRAVSGFANILLQDHASGLSADGRRCLEVIDANARRMGALIDALLSLGRLSRLKLREDTLDLDRLAREVCDELAPDWPAARIVLGALPPARGDATLVKQVLANLVGNALKYSAGTPSPQVEIRAENGFYEVRDNGAGFDMTYADKLFRPFERLHSESEFQGTGIGLAIVKRIIERHGGAIEARAEPGRGARFRFTLGGGVGL